MLCRYVIDKVKMCMKKFNDEKIFLINLWLFLDHSICMYKMMLNSVNFVQSTPL